MSSNTEDRRKVTFRQKALNERISVRGFSALHFFYISAAVFTEFELVIVLIGGTPGIE